MNESHFQTLHLMLTHVIIFAVNIDGSVFQQYLLNIKNGNIDDKHGS